MRVIPKPSVAREREVAEALDMSELLTPWERFLHCISMNFSDADAARRSGLTPAEVRKRKRDDLDFAADYHAAYDDATDRLETEAMTRALKCSDYLLWNMLKGRRRQVYGDKVQLDSRALVIQTNLDFGVVKRFEEAMKDVTPPGKQSQDDEK